MKGKSYFVLIGVSFLCATAFLGGCSQLLLFDPKGPIGDAERFVIIAAFVLMLIVVIPVFVMAFWFPWRYRASNTKAIYTPKWSYSGKINWVIWLVPVAIVTVLGFLAWSETHRLDPYKPVEPGLKPISIDVVSLNWKWLFIYPDLDIARYEKLAKPSSGHPVTYFSSAKPGLFDHIIRKYMPMDANSNTMSRNSSLRHMKTGTLGGR